jgi:lipopolysaccharide transport system ATP-binding protein
MTPIAVSIESVSKQYRLGAASPYFRLTESLHNGLMRLARLPLRPFRAAPTALSPPVTLWALRDVSLQVPEGEVLGIIGRNGAGKSTLLKILARITCPTSGRIGVRGRLGCLLEVGAGFHPELTGRENVYLNGAILGMSRREIRGKFDEIVAFAEIERFLDTPVKRYSSGMYTRLAFAVAAHLEPEILLIDEVLAVGDAAFQRKCLGKISGLARSHRTILFVSHNMQAVSGLCSRVALLDEGRLVADGEPEAVTRRYLEMSDLSRAHHRWDASDQRAACRVVRLHELRVRRSDGRNEIIDMSTPLDVEVEYSLLVPGVELDFTIHFWFEGDAIAFPASTIHCPAAHPPRIAGRHVCVCHIPGGLLRDGVYTLGALVLKDGSETLMRFDHVVSLNVAEAPGLRKSWFGRRPGVVCPMFDWSVRTVESAPDVSSPSQVPAPDDCRLP